MTKDTSNDAAPTDGDSKNDSKSNETGNDSILSELRGLRADIQVLLHGNAAPTDGDSKNDSKSTETGNDSILSELRGLRADFQGLHDSLRTELQGLRGLLTAEVRDHNRGDLDPLDDSFASAPTDPLDDSFATAPGIDVGNNSTHASDPPGDSSDTAPSFKVGNIVTMKNGQNIGEITKIHSNGKQVAVRWNYGESTEDIEKLSMVHSKRNRTSTVQYMSEHTGPESGKDEKKRKNN
jgi:hypothetical protein